MDSSNMTSKVTETNTNLSLPLPYLTCSLRPNSRNHIDVGSIQIHPQFIKITVSISLIHLVPGCHFMLRRHVCQPNTDTTVLICSLRIKYIKSGYYQRVIHFHSNIGNIGFPVNAGLFFKSFFYIAMVYLKNIIM